MQNVIVLLPFTSPPPQMCWSALKGCFGKWYFIYTKYDPPLSLKNTDGLLTRSEILVLQSQRHASTAGRVGEGSDGGWVENRYCSRNVRVGSTLIPESKTWFCVLHSAKKDENYFPLFSVFTKHLSARQEGLISLFKILQPIGSGYLLTYILCHYTGVSLWPRMEKCLLFQLGASCHFMESLWDKANC